MLNSEAFLKSPPVNERRSFICATNIVQTGKRDNINAGKSEESGMNENGRFKRQ